MLFTFTGSGAHLIMSGVTTADTAIALPGGTNALRVANFSSENVWLATGIGSAPTAAMYDDFLVKPQTVEVVGIDPKTTHVAVRLGSAVNATIALCPGHVC